MKFQWDEQKNRANRTKHGISFEAAASAFDDPLRVVEIDGDDYGEERWRLLGLVDGVVILFVVFTYRASRIDAVEIVRIISARRALPAERQVYDENTRHYR